MTTYALIFILVSMVWICLCLARRIIKRGHKKRRKETRLQSRIDLIIEADQPSATNSTWNPRRVY